MQLQSILRLLFLCIPIFLLLLFLGFRLAKSITEFIAESHFALLRLNFEVTLLWSHKGRTVMCKAFLFLYPIEDVKFGDNTFLFFLYLIGLDVEEVVGYLALALGVVVEDGGLGSLSVLEEGSVLVLAALARSGLVKEKTHYNRYTYSH